MCGLTTTDVIGHMANQHLLQDALMLVNTGPIGSELVVCSTSMLCARIKLRSPCHPHAGQLCMPPDVTARAQMILTALTWCKPSIRLCDLAC